MNIFVTLIQHKWTSIDRFIVTKHLILHAMYLEQKKKHRKICSLNTDLILHANFFHRYLEYYVHKSSMNFQNLSILIIN